MRLPTQLNRQDFVYSAYAHVAPGGVSIDEVVKPSYWTHIAPSLRARDVIEVIAEDCAYEVKLRVVNATKGALRLRVMACWESEAEAVEMVQAVDAEQETDDELTIGWGGPAHQFRVLDPKTKEVVSHGHASREEAEAARDALMAKRAA